MTKKQMRKIAQEIVRQNNIHETASSQEDRDKAEKKLFLITRQILDQPHGLELMDEIDAVVQSLL